MQIRPIAADQDPLIPAREWLAGLIRQAPACFFQDERAYVGNDGMAGDGHDEIGAPTGDQAPI